MSAGTQHANGKHVGDRLDQLPPHDLGSEKALLGCILREPSCIVEVSTLISADAFYVYAHKRIFEAMMKLHGASEPLDTITLATLLTKAGLMDEVGGHTYLAILPDEAPAAANYKAYAATIRDKAKVRSLQQFARELESRSVEVCASPMELVDFAANVIRDIANGSADENEFGEPVPASELQPDDTLLRWIWHGLIPEKRIVLLSALWKCGKTTLLSYLLRSTRDGSECCEREVAPANVLYITEESEDGWKQRRDKIGFGDNVHFWCRPFLAKPGMVKWRRFLEKVRMQTEKIKANLVIFDTISSLWPVREENNAGEVQEALMPLWTITPQAAIMLVHHLKKGDGAEATASRGSGALPSFVDTILELRRFDARDHLCRKRVLAGYGRSDETPAETIIELAADGSGYRNLGTKRDDRKEGIRQALFSILPTERPGMTYKDIKEAWPDDEFPTKAVMLEVLNAGTDKGDWTRDGTGKAGSPFMFLMPPMPS